MNPLKNFTTALQFLTTINLKKSEITEKSLAKSTSYFPLIGILIGSLSALIYIISSKFFPPTVTSVFIIISLIWVTRGLHIDGFIDTIDGLFGGSTKEDRLRIMKDTNVGSFGIAAIVCLILLKFTLILEIIRYANLTTSCLILILMPAISRWNMICAMYFFPYARKVGTGAFTKFSGARETAAATIITIISSLLLFRVEGLIILFIAFIFMLLISKYISLKIGGMTGDTYGALNEITEVLVLIYLLLI